MIDVLNETLIDPKKASELQPFRNARTGKPASLAKIWRLISYGAKDANGDRVRLEVVRTPSGIRTSLEAVERFIRALTDPDAEASDMRTHGQRRRGHDRAVASLEKSGWAPVAAGV